MLPLVPVKKLSTHSTSPPSASSFSHRCEPMNPAPPVTSTRFRIAYFLISGIERVRPCARKGSKGLVRPPGRIALDEGLQRVELGRLRARLGDVLERAPAAPLVVAADVIEVHEELAPRALPVGEVIEVKLLDARVEVEGVDG